MFPLVCLVGWSPFSTRRADLIVPVSQSIQESIRRHGVPEERIQSIPNGIDPDLFSPADRENEKRRELGVDERTFLVSYIGTHGMAHGLERVVEAAHLLRDRADIHFAFIGDGARKESVVEHTRELGVQNIMFLPPKPKVDVPKYLAASDLSLVSLLDLPVFATVLPSKMFEIMACGRPVLLIGKGESANLLREAEAGRTLDSNTPEAIAKAIQELANQPEQTRRFGENGRRYVLEHFNRYELGREYLARLESEFAHVP